MDPVQQMTLYQKNRVNMMLYNVNMMLYNTGFWSAGDFLTEEPARMLLYNVGSWWAGDLILEEPGEHAVM